MAKTKTREVLEGEIIQATTPDRPEQVRAVIELMEQGTSENKACSLVGINRNTFRSAALKNELADEYARALAALAQDQVEKAEQTIEDMRKGIIDAQMARVELDARKWFASKFLPRRYGDKLDIDSNSVVTHKYEDMDDDQLNKLIAARANRAA